MSRTIAPPTPVTAPPTDARPSASDRPASYWRRTRGPSASLLAVVPLVILYEAGVAALGGDAWRAGVDDAIGRLNVAGLTIPPWAASLGLVAGLVAWAVVDRRRERLPVRWLPAMAAESLALGAGLIGLFLLFDRSFERYAGGIVLGAGGGSAPGAAARVVEFLGAGLFEEAVFRLCLLPAAFGMLRTLRTPVVPSAVLAVTGSALAFSMAHHIDAPGGAFTWSVFVFRWLAGVYFAWVFALRGFGVAVGAHVAYDLLVWLIPWPE